MALVCSTGVIEMNIMAQDVAADLKTRYIANAKHLCDRGAGKCRKVVIELLIPQTAKCFIFGVGIYKEKLVPHFNKSSSRIRDELVKIHNKQNWFKRCSGTLIDNAIGLGMAMLAGKIVQSNVEVQGFSNLWGLLATRPVVSESTYEVLSFSVEFMIALIVFTLTEHFLDEYRQRNNAVEPARLSNGRQGEVKHQADIER